MGENGNGRVVAVSHCLLGCPCRYDGASRPNAAVRALAERDDLCLLPVCPERASGLPVPRPPAERVGERVVLADGTDVTDAFAEGSRREAGRVLEAGCDLAILKAKSPSCGTGRIYDGTFSGTLTEGWGTMAALLRDAGVRCVSEMDVERRPS